MNQEAITQLKGMLPKHREKPKSEPTPEELLAKARVTPMTELPALDNLFEIGDTPCFYRGELVASCGKAKSGKTLFQSIIMAGTLRRETLFLKRKEESWLKMLWIDTEQSSQTTQDIIVNRIIPLVCEEATEEEIRKLQEGFDEWFYAFNLRGLGFELRQQLLALTITTIHPDIVIIDGIKAKKPGDPDNAEMRFMKGRILTCESIMGCMYMGVRRDHIHELALPFYESNPYGRGKVTDADVLLIKKIIENVKPHQIFFADDLSDPYGTHMRATNALLLAIDELKEADFMQECRMWMYRGQWGTWDIDHIEMAVPMSPEEFTYKVNGVLKHQSQIHDAPFRDPGDGQLSWQKTIDRNKDTADLYASLGLATYEAMEAFVQYHPER